MKAKALMLAGGLTLPLISLAAPYSLIVPDGEYALVAAWRFQGIQTPFIGQAAPWQFYKYSPPTNFDIYIDVLGAWTPANPVSFAGEGGIVQPNGGSDTFLFQQHAAPQLPLNLLPGFNLVCCQTDIVASFEDIVGTPPANGTLLYQFNAGPGRNPFNFAAPDYTIFTFANGAWSPANPVVGITEAVFIYQPPQLSNIQIAPNGISFEVTPPINQQLVIEYTDSLTQPSWQPLTNIVGSGSSIKITDNLMGASVQQRFYRARSTP